MLITCIKANHVAAFDVESLQLEAQADIKRALKAINDAKKTMFN
jgi:hypothetical protein